jgi:hypothetical protein
MNATASIRRILAASLGLALLATFAHSAAAAAASDWEWTFTPYAWATEVSAQIDVNDQQVADQTIELDDLVDATDFTGQIDITARKGRHGALLDVFYVDLGSDDARFTLPGPAPIPAVAKTDVRLTIAELGGTFNPRGDGRGLTLVYGLRAIDRSMDIDATIPLAPGVALNKTYDLSETLYDALVGVGYAGRINDRWSFKLRADASTGDTDLTWEAEGDVGYSFGRDSRYTVIAGYRYFDAQFKKADVPAEVDIDATLQGFLGGLRISF